MIDNELRQQYRQAVGNLRIEFEKNRLCKEAVNKLSKILRLK